VSDSAYNFAQSNDELSSVLINILDLKFLQKHTIGKASSKFNLYIVWLQTFIAFLEKIFLQISY
jgi:hypothetical protein